MADYPRLGWDEGQYDNLIGYSIGSLQRITQRPHVIRGRDRGPGALGMSALCGGLQGVSLVGIRKDGDTHHYDGKRRVTPHPTALEAIASMRQPDQICPRCKDRAQRAKEATR